MVTGITLSKAPAMASDRSHMPEATPVTERDFLGSQDYPHGACPTVPAYWSTRMLFKPLKLSEVCLQERLLSMNCSVHRLGSQPCLRSRGLPVSPSGIVPRRLRHGH